VTPGRTLSLGLLSTSHGDSYDFRISDSVLVFKSVSGLSYRWPLSFG